LAREAGEREALAYYLEALDLSRRSMTRGRWAFSTATSGCST
jgi:hypothetical protein